VENGLAKVKKLNYSFKIRKCTHGKILDVHIKAINCSMQQDDWGQLEPAQVFLFYTRALLLNIWDGSGIPKGD